VDLSHPTKTSQPEPEDTQVVGGHSFGRFTPFLLLLAVYLIVGSLYAYHTPEWQAPDEPAHYNYVRQLANRQLPVIQEGDYDQEYQSLVISSRFDQKYSVESFEYEDYQPPLYYLLLTPVYWLSDGSLFALRLVSVILGAGVVILTYVIACRLFANRRWLSLTTTAFVAFLPQHVAMLASVNNDSLAELLIAAIILTLLYLVPDDTAAEARKGFRSRQWILVGILLGLGFITKVTVYIMLPIIGGFILGLAWRDKCVESSGQLRTDLGRRLLMALGPAIIIGAFWWGRNIAVYGGLDVLGTAAHNQIVVGQPRTSDWIDQRGLGGTFRAFIQTTFQSFWGQFGWMGVVMPRWVYRLLTLFSLFTVGGMLWAFRQSLSRIRHRTDRGLRRLIDVNQFPVLIVTGTFGLSLLVYLVYNLTFVQHQGRYLFSSLIPIGLGVTAGWAVLLASITSKIPPIRFLLPTGLALALAGLDIYALFKFIVPALT